MVLDEIINNEEHRFTATDIKMQNLAKYYDQTFALEN